jgi:hypothetical protein
MAARRWLLTHGIGWSVTIVISVSGSIVMHALDPWPADLLGIATHLLLSFAWGGLCALFLIRFIHYLKARMQKNPKPNDVRPRFGSLKRAVDGTEILLVFRASNDPNVFIGLDAGTEIEVVARPEDRLHVDVLGPGQSVVMLGERREDGPGTA